MPRNRLGASSLVKKDGTEFEPRRLYSSRRDVSEDYEATPTRKKRRDAESLRRRQVDNF